MTTGTTAVDIGCPIAAPPEEVFAAWVDGARFAEIAEVCESIRSELIAWLEAHR